MTERYERYEMYAKPSLSVSSPYVGGKFEVVVNNLVNSTVSSFLKEIDTKNIYNLIVWYSANVIVDVSAPFLSVRMSRDVEILRVNTPAQAGSVVIDKCESVKFNGEFHRIAIKNCSEKFIHFPKVNTIEIESCNKLEEIIIKNINYLNIEKCPELKKIRRDISPRSDDFIVKMCEIPYIILKDCPKLVINMDDDDGIMVLNVEKCPWVIHDNLPKSTEKYLKMEHLKEILKRYVLRRKIERLLLDQKFIEILYGMGGREMYRAKREFLRCSENDFFTKKSRGVKV